MKKHILKLFLKSLVVLIVFIVPHLIPATEVDAQCFPDCMFANCGDPDGCGGCCNSDCGVGLVCNNCVCQAAPVCGDGIVSGNEECDSSINCGEDCKCVEGYVAQAGVCLPALACKGFYSPFDVTLQFNKKVDRAIPLKIELFHMDTLVTDADISPPVVNINYYVGSGDGIDVTDQLEPIGNANEGNIFRFEPSGYWIYNLGTKQYSAPGAYEVTVSPGDTNYFIAEPGCFGSFIRLP